MYFEGDVGLSDVLKCLQFVHSLVDEKHLAEGLVTTQSKVGVLDG